MNSSALLLVVTLFVSIYLTAANNIKQMCDIFKPNGAFNGIKVYEKYKNISGNRLNSFMFAKGKEWQFIVNNNRIILLEETIRDISLNPKLNSSESVLFQFNAKQEMISSDAKKTFRVIQCFMMPSNELYCDSNLIKHEIKLKSMISFNPSSNSSGPQWIGLLDKTNQSNVFFFDPFNEELKTQNKCQECIVPKFLKDISIDMLSQLDGVINLKYDLSNARDSWLLFFNKNSKPFICIIDTNMSFENGCKEENLREYGYECSDSLSIIDFLFDNKFFAVILVIIGFVLFDLGIVFGYIIGRCEIQKDKKSSKREKPNKKNGLSFKAMKELGVKGSSDNTSN